MSTRKEKKVLFGLVTVECYNINYTAKSDISEF